MTYYQRVFQMTQQCDHGHECQEARKLPLGGGSNLILCRRHYEKEMLFREERNRELPADCKFELPEWQSLAVYGEDM